MNLENSVNNSKKKVNEPEPELIFCNWKECSTRGDYIYCYFDIFKNCDVYKEHIKSSYGL